jgi:hypothetical protein
MSKMNLDKFLFRGLHPNVFIGMASDRYARWIGQTYSEERYKGGITRRTHTLKSARPDHYPSKQNKTIILKIIHSPDSS